MSYISSLNLLNEESPTTISEESLREELSLWENAQFTFDMEPGAAILDEISNDLKTSETNLAHRSNLSTTSSDIGDHQKGSNSYMMSTYLLPQITQPVGQDHQQRSLPRLAPAPLPKNNDLESSWLSSPSTPTTPTAPVTPNNKVNTGKRKSLADMDPQEKASAEEDKRRRNTAASARFRMKKKLREQALENTAKEMTSKTEALEKRVKELEMEAKWLRALVIEKDPALLESPRSNPDTSST